MSGPAVSFGSTKNVSGPAVSNGREVAAVTEERAAGLAAEIRGLLPESPGAVVDYYTTKAGQVR